MQQDSQYTTLSANLLNQPNNMLIKLSSWSVIKVIGDQAQVFLQGQLTCDMSLLQENSSTLSALCNHQGRVLAVLMVHKVAAGIYCLMPNSVSQQFITHLTKYAVFSKVTFEDVTQDFFMAGGYQLESKEGLNCCVISRKNTSIVWGDKLQAATLFNNDDVLEDEAAWKQHLISHGLPFIYSETIGSFTPHMLHLQNLEAVSFNKGCYVGQEIIARTQYLGKSKRHLYRATIADCSSIEPGSILTVAGKEAGQVVDAVHSTSGTSILAVLSDNFLSEDIYCSGSMVTGITRCK